MNRLILMLCFNLITGIFISQNSAKITGQNVILRAGHSISSQKVGTLYLNQYVTILEIYSPTNNTNEAVLKKEIIFTNEYTGAFAFKLNSGRAVRVIEALNDNYYRITFKQSNGTSGYAKVNGESLNFINGQAWYLIQTTEGKTGWVFSKFIQEL